MRAQSSTANGTQKTTRADSSASPIILAASFSSYYSLTSIYLCSLGSWSMNLYFANASRSLIYTLLGRLSSIPSSRPYSSPGVR
uniref:Secreted protein n=1 Tax=Macrostomum lignano TaxID=282301 RepID=A0A1I8GNE8_9PLAT